MVSTNDIAKDRNVLLGMGDFLITYDPMRQGYLCYFEICNVRVKVVEVHDSTNEKITDRIKWLTDRATWVQERPDRPYGPTYRKCTITPEIMIWLHELQRLVEMEPRRW